jgi:beta-lactamase superfamily II metal-dependent hydrolase
MSSQSKKSVIIRMYNVGFGDSFLLRFPTPDGGQTKVLVDCGVHLTASIKPVPIKDVVARIIKDVTDSDGVPRIDVVIATHRHQDHVCGFGNAGWASVEVKEVWMPWTEHPTDKQARKIREAQSKSASHTVAAANRKMRLALSPAESEKLERAAMIAGNNLTNLKAMKTLHEGFSDNVQFARRRYLPEKAGGQTLEIPVLPGLKVHVMGPSRDTEVIARMEEESEMYHLAAAVGSQNGAQQSPFKRRWKISAAKYNTNPAYRHLAMTGSDMIAVDEAGGSDEFAAAARLEGAVNGTSLMIMFEVGKAFLLFPGDAQWGTWDEALSRWRELLEQTTFYKIGHHASHNATPITFVEKVLGDNFWAMACTGPTKKWTEIIPRQKLMQKLREKSKNVVRSDKQDVPDPTVSTFKRDSKNAYTELEVKI